jgi:hypothetical protein
MNLLAHVKIVIFWCEAAKTKMLNTLMKHSIYINLTMVNVERIEKPNKIKKHP